MQSSIEKGGEAVYKGDTTMKRWMTLLPLVLCGCAFVNVNLDRGISPYEEQTVLTLGKGSARDKVLILEIEGVLLTQQDGGLLGKESSLVSDTREKLKKAGQDERVKAVVLRINTPGGSVSGSDLLYEEIRRFKEKKKCPVVASFLDTATSGGYYVAMSSDEIVCQPTSVTGSIGVMMQLFGATGLMEKLGLEDRALTAGALKNMGSPFKGMSEEERKTLQDLVNRFHERFIHIVDQGRPELDRQQVHRLADGRVFDGEEALALGLVDRLGYLPDAIERASELAEITACKAIVYRRGGGHAGSPYSPKGQATTILINWVDLADRLCHTRFWYLWLPSLGLPF